MAPRDQRSRARVRAAVAALPGCGSTSAASLPSAVVAADRVRPARGGDRRVRHRARDVALRDPPDRDRRRVAGSGARGAAGADPAPWREPGRRSSRAISTAHRRPAGRRRRDVRPRLPAHASRLRPSGAAAARPSPRRRVVARLGPSTGGPAARQGASGGLPRVWVPRDVGVAVGDTLADTTAGARCDCSRSPGSSSRRASVRSGSCTGTRRSSSGPAGELRLGASATCASSSRSRPRCSAHLGPDVGYLDVTVPERPVAGVDSEPQVEG